MRKLRDTIINLIDRHLYAILIGVFFLWMLFFDDFSLVDRFKTSRSLNNAKEERQELVKEIIEKERRYDQLLGNKESLERYAREIFLMKEPDEDLFIVTKEEDKLAP